MTAADPLQMSPATAAAVNRYLAYAGGDLRASTEDACRLIAVEPLDLLAALVTLARITLPAPPPGAVAVLGVIGRQSVDELVGRGPRPPRRGGGGVTAAADTARTARAGGRVVLGVDPGGTSTGLAVRDVQAGRAGLLDHVVVDRVKADRWSHSAGIAAQLGDYLQAVVAACLGLAGEHRVDQVAVEDVVRPNPTRGVIDPTGALQAAVVCGTVLAALTPRVQVVLVAPGGNGSQILASYPDDLVTAGERAKGLFRQAGSSATVRHARSAWDVAGRAPHPRLAATVTTLRDPWPTGTFSPAGGGDR